MVFACRHANSEKRSGNDGEKTEGKPRKSTGEKRRGKGQSSGVPVEDREEGEGGKPHGEDVVGWGEGWPSELECEARHLSHAPGESTNGGIKKKKKNHELHGLIPTADLAAVCGTVYTMSGVGGRLPPPLQCCARCTPAASSADP